MYEGEAITRIMAFGDNVSATDADSRPRRRRILQWLQDGHDQVWNAYNWAWKLQRPSAANLILPALSYEAPLPADFGNMPAGGGIFDGPQRQIAVNPQSTQSIQQGSLSLGSQSISYSVYGWSPTLQKRVVQFGIQGPLNLWMYYNRKPPQLADRPWDAFPTLAAGAAGAVNGTVTYLVTYTTIDGYDHEPGDQVSITVASKHVIATLPDPGPRGEHKVLYVNLFRTVSGGSVFYRVARVLHSLIAAGTITVDDNITDATLVALTPFVETSPLTQIPEDYHHTVLLSSTMSKAKRSKGDTRDWKSEYAEGLGQMIINERPRQEQEQRIPRSTLPGMW